MYGHVITKFSRMGSLPHFLTHGAPLRASRARAPLLYGETNSTKAKGGNRDVIERYDTHKGDIRKIRHSGPG